MLSVQISLTRPLSLSLFLTYSHSLSLSFSLSLSLSHLLSLSHSFSLSLPIIHHSCPILNNFQSGPGSNGNEELLHTLQISRVEASPLDAILYRTADTPFGWYSQCILSLLDRSFKLSAFFKMKHWQYCKFCVVNQQLIWVASSNLAEGLFFISIPYLLLNNRYIWCLKR